MPQDVNVVDAGMARELGEGKLLWPFELATDEIKELLFWVHLPSSASNISITGNIAITTEAGELVNYSSVLLPIVVSNE